MSKNGVAFMSADNCVNFFSSKIVSPTNAEAAEGRGINLKDILPSREERQPSTKSHNNNTLPKYQDDSDSDESYNEYIASESRCSNEKIVVSATIIVESSLHSSFVLSAYIVLSV